jgi:hypothetical protein
LWEGAKAGLADVWEGAKAGLAGLVSWVKNGFKKEETQAVPVQETEQKSEATHDRLTAAEAYQSVLDAVTAQGLMGTPYESTGVKGREGVPYLCTMFLEDAIRAVGNDPADYISSLRASDSANGLEGVFTPRNGENPPPGAYVFYKEYDDKSKASGHVGFVLIKDGSLSVLHNGGSVNPHVQETNLGAGNFNSLFFSKYPGIIRYKSLSAGR